MLIPGRDTKGTAVAMKIRNTFPAAAVATLLLTAGHAAAQSGVSSTLAADFEVRIQRLERELSVLTGRYEESQYEIRQLRDRLERQADDLEYRLNALESGGKGGASAGRTTPSPAAPPPAAAPTAQRPAAGGTLGGPQTTPPPVQPQSSARAQPAGPLPSDPQKAYEVAFGYLRESNFEQAEKALNEFLARNGSHTLAGNAQYWLGETYFARGKYTEAAVAFATGAQKYPKGVKGPVNLLKLGRALGKIHKKTEACTALAQLPQKYPEASASVKKRADGERRVLKCPGA